MAKHSKHRGVVQSKVDKINDDKIVAALIVVLLSTISVLLSLIFIGNSITSGCKDFNPSWTADKLYKEQGYVVKEPGKNVASIFVGSKISDVPEDKNILSGSLRIKRTSAVVRECYVVPVSKDKLITSSQCAIPDGSIYVKETFSPDKVTENEKGVSLAADSLTYKTPPDGFIKTVKGKNFKIVYLNNNHYEGVVDHFQPFSAPIDIAKYKNPLYAFTPSRMAVNVIPEAYMSGSKVSVSTTLLPSDVGAPVFDNSGGFVGFYSTSFSKGMEQQSLDVVSASSLKLVSGDGTHGK